MSSEEIAIKVSDLSKCYQIYDKPSDRLKQSIYPRLQRCIGMPAKQYFREFWALVRNQGNRPSKACLLRFGRDARLISLAPELA